MDSKCLYYHKCLLLRLSLLQDVMNVILHYYSSGIILEYQWKTKYGFLQATEGGGHLWNWGRAGKVRSYWWHHVILKAGTWGYLLLPSACDSLGQLQYTTTATHTLTNTALWIAFFVVFWVFFFRLNVLTVFSVSFLATRTTKGMFALSFVDRCHLCLCFRLEFTSLFSEPAGNQEPVVLSAQTQHSHLPCCFEQHCTALLFSAGSKHWHHLFICAYKKRSMYSWKASPLRSSVGLVNACR